MKVNSIKLFNFQEVIGRHRYLTSLDRIIRILVKYRTMDLLFQMEQKKRFRWIQVLSFSLNYIQLFNHRSILTESKSRNNIQTMDKLEEEMLIKNNLNHWVKALIFRNHIRWANRRYSRRIKWITLFWIRPLAK
jgi:hypothetical protein